jgi:hypothetical protein
LVASRRAASRGKRRHACCPQVEVRGSRAGAGSCLPIPPRSWAGLASGPSQESEESEESEHSKHSEHTATQPAPPDASSNTLARGPPRHTLPLCTAHAHPSEAPSHSAPQQARRCHPRAPGLGHLEGGATVTPLVSNIIVHLPAALPSRPPSQYCHQATHRTAPSSGDPPLHHAARQSTPRCTPLVDGPGAAAAQSLLQLPRNLDTRAACRYARLKADPAHRTRPRPLLRAWNISPLWRAIRCPNTNTSAFLERATQCTSHLQECACLVCILPRLLGAINTPRGGPIRQPAFIPWVRRGTIANTLLTRS